MAGEPIRKVILIGATGKLGSHILRSLIKAGFEVTAVQREDSTNTLPSGINSVRVDLLDEKNLTAAFTGQDAVVSAVPTPKFAIEKVMIDAAIAASVKRIIPSEFTTNPDTPLSQQLPISQEKLKIRRYLESSLSQPGSPTTWTCINTGPFFEVCMAIGALGPNLAQKKATFHNGGQNLVGVSRWADIGDVVAKVLQPAYFDQTANQVVHMYSAAITEYKLTEMATKVTGIDFGTVDDGRIIDVDVDQLMLETVEKLKGGDLSVMYNFFFQTMYGEGYGGADFQKLSWKTRLGLKTMTDEDLEEAIRQMATTHGAHKK